MSQFLLFLVIILQVADLLETFDDVDFRVNISSHIPHSFRITGGYRPAKHTLAKHIVSVRVRSSIDEMISHTLFGVNHCCGGSILSASTILTAGHCVVYIKTGRKYKPDYMYVVAGSAIRVYREKTAQIIDVQNITLHHEYNSSGYLNNDIAILHLEKDIREDGITAQRIPLVSKKTAARTVCTTCGWGKILRNGPLGGEVTYVNLDIVSTKECGKEINRKRRKYILDTHICAQNIDEKGSIKGACSGDSGGPLVCNKDLVGVLSFCGRKGCEGGQPIVFTDVFAYLNWIQNRAGKLAADVSLYLLIMSAMFVSN